MAANQGLKYNRLSLIDIGLRTTVSLLLVTEDNDQIARCIDIIRCLEAKKKAIHGKRPLNGDGIASGLQRFCTSAPALSDAELSEVDFLLDVDENPWPVCFLKREDRFFCRRPGCNPLYGHTLKGAKEHWVAIHHKQQSPADQFEALIIFDFLGRLFEELFMQGEGHICPICEETKTVLDSKWSYVLHLKQEHADTLEPLEVSRGLFAFKSSGDGPVPPSFLASCMHPIDASGDEIMDRWMCLSEDCNNFYPMCKNELQSHFNSDHTQSALANIKRNSSMIHTVSIFFSTKRQPPIPMLLSRMQQ